VGHATVAAPRGPVDFGKALGRHLPPALRHRHHRGQRTDRTAGERTGDRHRVPPDRSGAGSAVAVQDHASGCRSSEAAGNSTARSHAGANCPQGQQPPSGADRPTHRHLEKLSPNFDTLMFAWAGNSGRKASFYLQSIAIPMRCGRNHACFCPALGIPEDPVSGQMPTPCWAAYLWDLGQFGKEITRFHGPAGLPR